jgi:hypothetical protein
MGLGEGAVLPSSSAFANLWCRDGVGRRLALHSRWHIVNKSTAQAFTRFTSDKCSSLAKGVSPGDFMVVGVRDVTACWPPRHIHDR